MKIYLIRHGETISNKEGRYLGITDVSLSEAGKEKILKKVKEGYYPEYKNQIIYTSGLSRTKETLELIYGEVPFIEEPRFNESNFGIFENKTYEELKENTDYRKWISGDYQANICPGGESYLQMKQRVIEAFSEVLEKQRETRKDVILFLHGGPLVALMEYIHPEEQKTYYEWRFENGECRIQNTDFLV